MADTRTRSDYRLVLVAGQYQNDLPDLVNLADEDRDGLAQLMLDAYRGSVDDEGETFDEALEAVDFSLANCLREHSFVLKEDGIPVAMSLVAVVRGTHYIDPVAVHASHKRAGLGSRLVQASLASLAQAGVSEIGAAITDGNVPSERLFARLGALRVGPWPPVEDGSAS